MDEFNNAETIQSNFFVDDDNKSLISLIKNLRSKNPSVIQNEDQIFLKNFESNKSIKSTKSDYLTCAHTNFPKMATRSMVSKLKCSEKDQNIIQNKNLNRKRKVDKLGEIMKYKVFVQNDGGILRRKEFELQKPNNKKVYLYKDVKEQEKLNQRQKNEFKGLSEIQSKCSDKSLFTSNTNIKVEINKLTEELKKNKINDMSLN